VKISVVLPNYNHGRYLAQSLASVLAQSYRDWELVVVDDGSTDGSRAIIADFVARERRVAPVLLPENRGVFAAIAAGMARASGELVFAGAADDCITNPQFFAQAAAALGAHKEAAGAFGAANVVDGASDRFLWRMGHAPRAGYIAPRVAMQAFLLGKLFVPGASAIWRRALVDQVGGFDPELGAQSDYFINHALPALHGVVFLPETVATFRHFPESYGHAASDETYFRRHALTERKLRALKLPYAIEPDWLSSWRETVIKTRLKEICQRDAFARVRGLLDAIPPGDIATVPPSFREWIERLRADSARLEEALDAQRRLGLQLFDELAGPLPPAAPPRAAKRVGRRVQDVIDRVRGKSRKARR
jgi:glycosyltransferase involved in cell wall biosynthesis